MNRTDRHTERAAVSPDRLLFVAKGGGFLAAGDLFNYVSRLVASLVLANLLGADRYGLYTLSVSLGFLVAGLGNLGLDAAMERYVAVYRNRKDQTSVRGTLQLGLGVTLLAAVTTGAGTYFAAGTVARRVFEDPRLTPMFQLVGLLVPFVIATALLTSVVRAFKRMDYSAFAENFIQPLVRLALIGVLALVGLTETVALIILVVSYVAATLVLLGMFHRVFPHVLVRAEARRETREIAAFSFPFWFSGILTQIRKNVQPVFLGVFSAAANVGIFSIATSANLLSSVSMMATRKSLRPILAETLDEGNEAQTRHLYQATTRWTLTAALPSFLVIILYPTELMGLFGKSFEAGAAALFVLAWADLSNAATGTCGTILDMSGLNRIKMINKVFEFAVTISLNVVLIPRWGLMGAAFAVLGSTVAIQLVRVIEVAVIVGLHPYNRRIGKPVMAGAVAYLAGLGLRALLAPDSGLFAFVLNVGLVVLVYVVVLLILGLTDEDRTVARAVLSRMRLPIPKVLR